MTKTEYFCDHCGEELNLLKDYDDIGIDIGISYITADLCSECMNELTNTVRDFCSRGERRKRG